MNIFKLPMVLVLLFVVFMIVIGESLAFYKYSFDSQLSVAAFIFIIGLFIVLAGGYSFRVAKTTVNPLTPDKSTQLVTSGVYALSRNPMYVGFLLWLISCAVFVGSLINLLFLVLYIVLANRFYIAREEKALGELFGKEYKKYKNRVRRWV